MRHCKGPTEGTNRTMHRTVSAPHTTGEPVKRSGRTVSDHAQSYTSVHQHAWPCLRPEEKHSFPANPSLRLSTFIFASVPGPRTIQPLCSSPSAYDSLRVCRFAINCYASPPSCFTTVFLSSCVWFSFPYLCHFLLLFPFYYTVSSTFT